MGARYDNRSTFRPVRGRSTALFRSHPWWLRVLGAVLLAVTAFAVSMAMHLPQQGYTFLLLYPAVIASAYFAGRDAGLAATGACTTMVAARMLLMWNDQRDMLLVQIASLLLFTVIGAGSAVLLSRLKRALRQLEVSNAQLIEANETARAAREETDLLLRELRHRVRNDLTNIIAIVRMQAKTLPEEAAAHLRGAADRLQVLAKVHQRLSRQGHSPVVEMEPFLRDLCSELRSTLLPLKPVALECDIDEISLPSTRAVSVGLIVNELVTNAIKYGYPDGREGTICVYLEATGGMVEVGVDDDGVGFCPDTLEVQGTGLGHRLVRSLAAQLGGRFQCSTEEGATSCLAAFPVEPPQRPRLDAGE